MICNLCEEKEAKYVIRNIITHKKLKVCTSCKGIFDIEKELSGEVKT